MMIMERLANALGLAVVHSLWQCAFIGALASAVLIGVRRVTLRYAIWCGALALSAGWFVLTLGNGVRAAAAAQGAAESGMVGWVQPIGGAAMPAAGVRLPGLLEWIALLWTLGFVLVFARSARQWGAARKLRTRGVEGAEGVWAELFEEVRASMGVSGRVRMLVSDVARSPMVVGWVLPAVVVPVSVLTMMRPDQVRLVLAHELAHIRRYDHLVNMLQVMIETVMFYHPVVWWMSHQARVEREHCCDDAAVRYSGDAVAFARALTELEEVRIRSRAVLALQGGSLMDRIRRLLDCSHTGRGRGSMRVLAACTAAALIGGAAYAHKVVSSEGPREETVAAVRASVESGVMTQDQAWEIFSAVIFPGSELERSLENELALWRAELRDAGLDSQEIDRRLEEVRQNFPERIERAFMMQVLGMDEREAALSMFANDLKRSVEQGGMSQEDADALYQAAVDGMGQPAPSAREQAVLDYKHAIEVAHAVRRAIEAQRHELDASVEAGAMTREAALARDEEMQCKYEAAALRVVEAERGLIELQVEDDAGEGVPQEVELVPVLEGSKLILKPVLREVEAAGGLILRGVGEDALRYQRATEQGSLSYFDRNIKDGFTETVLADVEAGRLTEREGVERINAKLRSHRFEARWMSVVHMYQEEVIAGRLSVEAANAHLRRALDDNGYYASEFAWDFSKGGIDIVEASRVFEVMVTPDGNPVGPAVEPAELQIQVEPIDTGRKLTPMDEEYFLHQGIRSLSEYDESFGDDC